MWIAIFGCMFLLSLVPLALWVETSLRDWHRSTWAERVLLTIVPLLCVANSAFALLCTAHYIWEAL